MALGVVLRFLLWPLSAFLCSAGQCGNYSPMTAWFQHNNCSLYLCKHVSRDVSQAARMSRNVEQISCKWYSRKGHGAQPAVTVEMTIRTACRDAAHTIKFPMCHRHDFRAENGGVTMALIVAKSWFEILLKARKRFDRDASQKITSVAWKIVCTAKVSGVNQKGGI